ncbi:COP9 signalosome complex subunit 8 [Panicum miliaceum]|uniref:COP9 signalosome complex subunit 8 n=1 Tax=Panicum miliaceum TaxID=4540 RepID=A0A3L6PSW4_PANMI|nr:COP9 signalosome complex subunit 8 [Panicum miliaceum]
MAHILSYLSAVQAALSDKSYSSLAPLYDDLLLQTASRGATTDEWPYAVHLLVHIYLNDLNNARFFWKLLPQEVKDARPELAAVWRVGQCLWNRDYAGVYTAAQGFEWGPDLAEFITAFLESYRKRIFQLLTSAYSTISVPDVAHFMGMSEEDATNYAVENGWSLDTSTKMLTVKKAKAQTNQMLDASKLQRLTECVFHLEH